MFPPQITELHWSAGYLNRLNGRIVKDMRSGVEELHEISYLMELGTFKKYAKTPDFVRYKTIEGEVVFDFPVAVMLIEGGCAVDNKEFEYELLSATRDYSINMMPLMMIFGFTVHHPVITYILISNLLVLFFWKKAIRNMMLEQKSIKPELNTIPGQISFWVAFFVVVPLSFPFVCIRQIFYLFRKK